MSQLNSLVNEYEEKLLKLKDCKKHYEKREIKLREFNCKVDSKCSKLDENYTKFLNQIDVS